MRLTGVQYVQEPVLAGSAGELTEVRINASLSGDYQAAGAVHQFAGTRQDVLRD